jgi:hypothetical protein
MPIASVMRDEMQPMRRDDLSRDGRGGERGVFSMIDDDTSVARHRLVDVLARAADCGGEARDILRLRDAASLLTAAGHRSGAPEVMIATELYLEIARGEVASLFGPAPAPTADPARDGISGIIVAELDDLAARLSCAPEPSRLFGLIFAIERARHLLFVSRPAAFAINRPSGRRLAVAGTLHPALSARLAALMNAAGATAADRALILGQAHATYDVVERVVRAWAAACPPATASVDPFARRPSLRAL